jgi:hypothetical protein
MSNNNKKSSNSPRRTTQLSQAQQLSPRREEAEGVSRREGGLPSPDYGELMDTLENAEQTLIEHMRTAGMKKTRECQLIDELFNLRKSRRQAFTLLTKDVTNTREHQEEQKLKSKYQLSQLKRIITDMQNDLDKKEYTLRNIQSEFKNKLEDVHVKYRQMLKEEVNGVKSNYEKKLSLLETKIEQVQQVAGKSSKKEEEEQAQKLQMVLEENNQRQNEKYTSSMQRCEA